MRGTGAAIALLLGTRLAYAQDAPAAEPQPAPAPESAPAPAPTPAPAVADTAPPPAAPAASKWFDTVTVSGIAEAFYNYKAGASSGEALQLRAFDGGGYDGFGFGSPGWAGGSNSFVPSLAKVAFDAQGEKFGFRTDIGFGPTMSLFNYYKGNITPVQQAFGTFKLTDSVSIDFGKFNTSAGSEVLENNNNFTFSRSMLFTYGPFVHTGAKLNIKATEELTVILGVLNGWDNDFDDNKDKTFQFTALYALPNGGALSFTTYQGKEGVKPADADLDWRMFYDLVYAQEINEQLKFNVNAAYGKQGDAYWYGVSGQARYSLSEMLALALRVEHFNDKKNFRFALPAGNPGENGSNVTAVTGVISVPFASNAEIRGEYRADIASKDIFTVDGEQKSLQMSAQLAAIAWF